MSAHTAQNRKVAGPRRRSSSLPWAAAVVALPLLAACGSSSPAPVAATTTSAAPASSPATTAAVTTAAAAPSTSAAPATSAPASTPAASSAAPACDEGALKVTPGSTDGAAGHEMDVFLITNAGAASCTVEGYPGVTLRSESGSKVAVVVTHDGDYTFPALTPAAVQIAPGAAASFAIGYTRAPQDDSQQCPSGRRLDVVLPGGTTATKLAVDVTACGKLAVSPVVTGANGPS